MNITAIPLAGLLKCLRRIGRGARSHTMTHTKTLIAIAILLTFRIASAQQVPPGNNNPQVFGISVNPDGVIEYRQRDANAELNKIKSRRPIKESPAEADKRLKFVSLVKISTELRNAIESNKPLSNDLKYLQGLTQIHYILLYPDDKDLIIAAPAEDIDATPRLHLRRRRLSIEALHHRYRSLPPARHRPSR